MIREKITVIEVIEVKKGWIKELINNVEYGYDPEFIDEDLVEEIRDSIL